jgi:hypothetical protein
VFCQLTSTDFTNISTKCCLNIVHNIDDISKTCTPTSLKDSHCWCVHHNFDFICKKCVHLISPNQSAFIKVVKYKITSDTL